MDRDVVGLFADPPARTAWLMAAYDVATGEAVGQMVERRRTEEFLAFLDQVCEGISPETPVHAILDKVSSYKSAEVKERLKGLTDWSLKFTPASASRNNAAVDFLSKLSRHRLKQAVFDSLAECAAAVEGCIEHRRATGARQFRWSRTPEDLADAWEKRHQKLQELAS